MKNFYNKGISLIETLIVISIVIILLVIVIPRFSSMKENQVLKNSVEDIISNLHSAQSQTLASVNSSEYGVRFNESEIIIFKGINYTEGSQDNKVIKIISPANISNVSLNGISSSTGELYFYRLSGIPSKTGTITVSTPSMSKVITVSPTGSINAN